MTNRTDQEEAVLVIARKHGIFPHELVASDGFLDFLAAGMAPLPFFVELGELYGLPLDRIKVEAETIESGYCETCWSSEAGYRVTIGG